MRRSTFFLSSWLPPTFWAGVIFYFSGIPGLNSGLGKWDFILRKIAHMVEFGLLAILLARGLRRSWTVLAPAGIIMLAGLMSVGYAISDEIHQAFVPRRGPSATDVVIDTIGIVVALWLTRRWNRPSPERVTATAKRLMVLLVAVVGLSGCGAEATFKRARAAEGKGQSYVAWQKYQAFAARYPDHAQAPEAVFRAGWLAQSALGDCDAARAFYERVQQKYPQSDPWSASAAFQSENCPDYFPLIGKMAWVEGDADSSGKNARVESTVMMSSTQAKIPFSSAIIARDYMAGTSKFKTVQVLYRKDGATVWEHPDGGEAPRIILKAPIREGTEWTAQVAGRTYTYDIVSTTRTVTVAAGTFQNCVVVRARTDKIPGAANEYYAPSVGRVMTSFSTDGGERRNLELLTFTPGDVTTPYQ